MFTGYRYGTVDPFTRSAAPVSRGNFSPSKKINSSRRTEIEKTCKSDVNDFMSTLCKRATEGKTTVVCIDHDVVDVDNYISNIV
jgi:hypothetical protein